GEISLKLECPSPKLRTLPLDVTSDESVAAAKGYIDEYLKQGLQLWGIVNNAGIFSCYGPDDWTKVSDYVNAAQVNTFGVIRVTHTFKRYIKRSEGRIVTVTSVNGRLSTACGGPYVVSKYGAEAYMDAIRFAFQSFSKILRGNSFS
ncbi:Serpentine receptor class gamma, partial [Trichostrongylus colubriformis]